MYSFQYVPSYTDLYVHNGERDKTCFKILTLSTCVLFCLRQQQMSDANSINKVMQFDMKEPVSIRVRIGSSHSLACCKRLQNAVVLRMRPENSIPCVTAGVAHYS
jgi:hypothetical protein